MLLDCPWLEVTAIDLLARHERIRQQDFFALGRSLRYQAVVSSMVINSVPNARARGEMLKRCHAYLEADRGHLFLMLPRSCLTHSRRLTLAGFKQRVLPHYGFRLVREHATPKVAFFVLQAMNQGAGEGEGEKKGEETKKGDASSSSSWAKDFAIDLV
jgi:25S rRNA (adenine2142-N1)-methyltransferase